MNILTSITHKNKLQVILFFIIGVIISEPVTAKEKELIVAIAKKDGLYGVIDTNGKWYIPDIYITLGEISEGFVRAVKNDFAADGFIHLKSKLFIPLENWNQGLRIENHDSLSVFDYTFIYKKKENNKVIYESSKYLLDSLKQIFNEWDTLYKPNYTFVDGIAPVWIGYEEFPIHFYENGKWGYINKQGKWIFPPEYDVGILPANGHLLLVQGSRETYYSIFKDTLISIPYKSGLLFKEGMNCVGIGDSVVTHQHNVTFYDKGKWGYIDTCYNLVIPLNFDIAFPFSEGLAIVYKKGKYGFIDKKGNLKIPYIYDSANDFSNERAYAMVDSLYGVINKKGQWIIKPQYKNSSKYFFGLDAVEINGKSGYIGINGNIKIPFIFEFAGIFNNAYQKNCLDCLKPIKNSHLLINSSIIEIEFTDIE